MLLRRVLVLGEGPLASAMAEDLERTRDLKVTHLTRIEGAPAGALAEQDVVISAIAADAALGTLRRLLEARQLVADSTVRVEEALPLDGLALEQKVAACVACGEPLARLLLDGAGVSEPRVEALLATALARRMLTGDFRDHWGVWTPERILARVGMAHGLRQDLRERGVALRS
jgi:saccharopine dehydrogenase-like NADP-dependent oxidoreductase